MAEDIVKHVKELVQTIQNDFFTEKVKTQKFKYAGVLKNKNATSDKLFWVKRSATGGLIQVVSPNANSPLGKKGAYRGFEADAVHFREVVPFGRDELEKIVSNDPNIRIAAKVVIRTEMDEQLGRAWNTRELVANSIIGRGFLRFSSMQNGLNVQVDKTFPIKTRTVSKSWSDSSATIVTDVNSFLNSYEDRVGSRPDFMRMTSRVFNDNVKTNTQIQAVYTNAFQFRKVSSDLNGAGREGFLLPEEVAKANGWPTIELYNERYHVEYTAKSAATAGNLVRIDLSEGTWGLFVGTKVLIGFGVDTTGNTDWAEEAVIKEIDQGKGIVVDTLDDTIAAGIKIAARPTFHPEDRILFGRNEQDSQFLEPAYGIDLVGDTPVLKDWRGIRTDAFMGGTEPNLMVYRRVMDAFGLMISSDNYESVKVIL